MKRILGKRLLLMTILSLGILALCYSLSLPWVACLFVIILLFFIIFRDWSGPSAVVIMNHGLSDRPEQYPLPNLVCHVHLFDQYLTMLKKAGFHFLSIQQFYQYKCGQYKLPAKSVLLTFDDGYLDNWVFAAPLLKKHSVRGVMYASQDFIEKSQRVRKRWDEVNYDLTAAARLECLNYCSERELQLMDQEGVLQVEAHAKSHSFYYSSDKIIGFYKQTEVDPFVEWNSDLDNKPFWMTSLNRKVPMGTPIFAYQPSCSNTKRYLPDPTAELKIGAIVQRMVQEKTPYDPKKVDKIMRMHPGRYETETETDERFDAELAGVKMWLEKLLQRPVDFLVWPHGGVSEKGIEVASRYYKLFQIPNSGISNKPSDPVNQMSRIGGLALLGTPMQQQLALWKIRAKMEIACGNYYWVLPFGLIKILEKTGLANRANYTAPKHYNYDFNLIES